MKLDSRIFVAGHRGLVGSSIAKELESRGYQNILTRSRDALDLLDSAAVEQFFRQASPEFVFVAAAKVGGIMANNTYRADFLYQNLVIQNNIIHSAYKYGVKKLLFLGSSCIYPKNAAQPITERALLTSELEYTNEPYAIAKIAGLKLCESYALQYGCNFISAMPTNLYGEGDNFDLETSHVLPALLRKIHLAKLLQEGKMLEVEKNVGLAGEALAAFLKRFGISAESVEIWGSGNPRREFLHTKDLARACVFVMENVDFEMLASGEFDADSGAAESRGAESKSADSGDLDSSAPTSKPRQVRNTHINIGFGSDVSIRELAELIKEIVGFTGALVFNTGLPDGTFQKLMDSSKINALGWMPQISLREGIQSVYKNYKTANS